MPGSRMFRAVSILLPILTAACAGQAAAQPRPTTALASPSQPTGFQIVLAAGDDSIPVFDNAIGRLQRDLEERAGVPATTIHRFSARARDVANGADLATRGNVLRAITALDPRPGQACLVYVTSHGAPRQGLVLTASDNTLLPGLLNVALDSGCRDTPTVLVLSGCFSGIYARPPVARANRIVITAARLDRTSFGCGADFTYTYFDECLLDAMDRNTGARTWRDAFDRARACVTTRENAMNETPSEPQAAFGAAVADMKLPWPPGG